MQTANMAFVTAHAARGNEHKGAAAAFGKALKASVEVGVLVPSVFRRNLEDAGYLVVDDKAAVADYGFASLGVLKRVLVVDEDGAIVAMGAATDAGEAIAAAALGWCREHPLEDLEATTGIAEAPTNPHAAPSN